MPRSSNRSFTSLRDSDQIEKTLTALDALETEPDIIAAMAPRKYTPEDQIGKGRALLQAVLDTVDDQTEEHGDRSTATRQQRDRLSGARDLYAPLAATARAVFTDDPDVLAALGLKGKHLNSYAERIRRMRGFAVELRKPDRLSRITDETEIEETALDELEAALVDAERKMSAQDRAEARGEDASDSRAAAFRAMEKWMLKMHGHARVVLRGRPQLLEMLGVSPRR